MKCVTVFLSRTLTNIFPALTLPILVLLDVEITSLPANF